MDEGPYQLFYLTRGVSDQVAMTLDCRHLIPVFIYIFRLLKFTVERTISCHSSAVSFSESDERLTDKDTIVVTDFAKRTGDAIFDDTLKTALTVSLQQSPFLNVLSGSQVAKTK